MRACRSDESDDVGFSLGGLFVCDLHAPRAASRDWVSELGAKEARQVVVMMMTERGVLFRENKRGKYRDLGRFALECQPIELSWRYDAERYG